MTIDTSAWSGEGEFTAALVEALKGFPGIDLIRVEDAPAGRADSGYSFLSNEVYVRFVGRHRMQTFRRWGVLPAIRRIAEPSMSLADLARGLAAIAGIGEADYEDEGLLQYLRTQRIVQPYQTRGIKLVELIRIYEIRA